MLFRQPQHGPFQIDWSNPITRGLVVACSGADPTTNHATKTPISRVNGIGGATTVDGKVVQGVYNGDTGLSVGTDSRYNPSELTVFVIATPDNLAGGRGYMLVSRDDATLGRAYTLEINPSSGWGVHWYINGGGSPGTNDLVEYVAPTTGRRYVAAGTYKGSSLKLYVDGELSAAVSSAPTKNSSTGDLQIGRRTYSGYNESFGGSIPLALVFNRELSDTEIKSLSKNPWQIYADHSDVELLKSSGGGASALAGNAQAVASASGALSVSTPVALAGAAVGVVTSTGAISSAMPLSGAAAAVAAASGTLVAGMPLAGGAHGQAGASGNITFGLSISGAALAAAVASGALGTQKPLAGGAQAQAGATGNLQATLPSSLAGDAQAAATATGQMQVQFSISGAALMQALATGGITVTGSTALAGPAQAAAQSTGALSTTIPLAGAAQMVASATGTLALGRPLAGAAVAVSVAGGLLTITTNLAGAAVAQAIASGYMALQIPVSGAALMQALAHGVLSGTSASLDTPKIRLLRVPAETRRIGHRIR